MVIIFCPHPKQIDVCDKEIRKIVPITISGTKVPESEHIQIASTEFMDHSFKLWINESIELVTVPRDRHGMDWIVRPR
jgi:hypothetical protein